MRFENRVLKNDRRDTADGYLELVNIVKLNGAHDHSEQKRWRRNIH
jgi:hypothetical protein